MNIKNFLTVAVLSALFASCGGGSIQFGDNEYPVETVKTQSANMQTTYPATIRGIQDVEIRPKISGFITKVCVKEGEAVHAGQLLFQIDSETYEAAVHQAQAAVNTANAQTNTAKLTYENSKKLYANNVIGQYELQSAENSYASAKASLAQAKAALASAQENLSFCYVKSPANGVVGSLPYKVGALVSAQSAEPLTTVSDTHIMEVFFSMTEKDVLEMTKNAGGINAAIEQYPAVKLQLADGSVYGEEGRVVKMSGVLDPTTGSLSMIAHFSNPDHLLKSGGSGSIIVPRTHASAIVIPQNATVEVQNKKFVYVVTKDNKTKYTEITVDPQNDGQTYVVLSGLKHGDRIVTAGITKLTDGMDIKPITQAEYDKKIAEAQQMGEANSSASKFVDTMKK